MPSYRLLAWGAVETAIDQTTDTYVEQFGETAYALMNAITDLSTRPPVQVCGYCFLNRERHSEAHEEPGDDQGCPYRFIRRERHGLQRLAGIWMAEFGRSVQQRGFDLDRYLRTPSRELLRGGSQRASGRSRRSRSTR